MKKIIVIILLCVALAVLFFTAFRLLKDRVGQGEAESISAVQNTPSSEFSHEKPVYFVGETRLKQNGEAFFFGGFI